MGTNGKTFTYTEASGGQPVDIDGHNLTVKVGAVNKLSKMTGDLIELAPGVNNVTINGTGLNGSVSFIFKPRFI